MRTVYVKNTQIFSLCTNPLRWKSSEIVIPDIVSENIAEAYDLVLELLIFSN